MSKAAKLMALAVVAAMSAVPSLASAKQNVTYTFSNSPHHGVGSGSFLDTYTFNVPVKGYVTVQVLSSITGPLTNVNIFRAQTTLNDTRLSLVSTGAVEDFQTITQRVEAGLQTLNVGGSSQKNGAYTGTFTFAAPEPATWMTMILGFGAIGFIARRARRQGGKLLAA